MIYLLKIIYNIFRRVRRPFIILILRIFYRSWRNRGLRVCVYSASFGSYDPFREIRSQSMPFDYLLFTDHDSPLVGANIVKVRAPFSDPRRAAKWFKINSHRIELLKGYDLLIYIDASGEFLSKYTLEILCAIKSLGFFKHPERSSILMEAELCQGMIKYRQEKLIDQSLFYTNEMGHKDDFLLAGGVIVRNLSYEHIDKFNSSWWKEMDRSLQDQLSLPFVLRKDHHVYEVIATGLYSQVLVRFNVGHRLNDYGR